MNLRSEMIDLILENEANKEKLREAQRLLNQVLHTPPPEPKRYILDTYFSVGTTVMGKLRLVRERSSFYADLRIKTEVDQYGCHQKVISVEKLGG
jgi:hypothetical protein